LSGAFDKMKARISKIVQIILESDDEKAKEKLSSLGELEFEGKKYVVKNNCHEYFAKKRDAYKNK